MTQKRTLLVVLSLLALLGAAPLASAQESTPEPNVTDTITPTPEATATSTATPTATPTSTSTATPARNDENTTYLIELEPGVRIVESSWNSGTVTFLVESDSSTTITVTDASIPLEDYDAVDIPQKRQKIPEGRTEITFSVSEPSSAAVTVASPNGLVGLSPGSPSLFSGTASWSDVQLAAVSGAAGVGIVAIIVVIRTVLGRTDSPERVA
jgi:hypothetical protein